MATRFLDKKTHRFHFTNADGDEKSYVLIFGDEVDAPATATGGDSERVTYRNRVGSWKRPPLSKQRSLEMYFLDVGQGDAAFMVTPAGQTVLVDGGLQRKALGFLIWKYRLDLLGNSVVINHLILSHGDKDHVEGLIPLLEHPQITVSNIHHNGIAIFNEGAFNTRLGTEHNGDLLDTHDSAIELAGLPLADSNSAVFAKWIAAVNTSGAAYGLVNTTTNILNIGDPDLLVEIVSPIPNPDGSYKWMSDQPHTINGNSLTFRLTYNNIRAFFSGDLTLAGFRRG